MYLFVYPFLSTWSAAVNIWAHIFLFTDGYISMGCIPRREIAWSKVYVFLILINVAGLLSKGVVAIYISTSNVENKFSTYPH